MSTNIDVTLDAQNEVTPTFTWFDINGKLNTSFSHRLVVQGVRTTNTSGTINIALDGCMLDNDGQLLQRHNGTGMEDAWHELDSDSLAISSSEHSEIRIGYSLYPGFMYRMRYNSAATAPIRIMIFTPYRRTVGTKANPQQA